MISLLEVSMMSSSAQEVSEGSSELAVQRNLVSAISPSTVQGSLVSLNASLLKVFQSSKDMTDEKNIPFIFNPNQTIRLLSSNKPT